MGVLRVRADVCCGSYQIPWVPSWGGVEGKRAGRSMVREEQVLWLEVGLQSEVSGVIARVDELPILGSPEKVSRYLHVVLRCRRKDVTEAVRH